MTGIHEHSLSAWNCKQRPASEYFVPFVAGQVCEACAFEGHVGAAPNGFRIEENQFTTEQISAEQIEQARRAIARFHEMRRTMIALGVIDEDPAPSAPVDEGLLQRYEQELTDARMSTLVAARAANDMRRVFLSDKEIQNADSDPESWEIAVTRAGQIRDQLNEVSGHPGLEIMTVIEEVKRNLQRARNELLILAATFVSPEHSFDDEEKLILTAVTAAKRGMSPWLLREKVELLEEIRAERDDLSAAYEAFRDLDLLTDGPHDSDCALFNEPAARARPCTCKSRQSLTARVSELERQVEHWKERARTAERGQPKFSRPVSPPVEDTDAPEPKDES